METKNPSETNQFDTHHIQGKIELIEKGLPIDISEEELHALEDSLRGARSFYLDILTPLQTAMEKGDTSVEADYVEESKNLTAVEVALRKIDEFRSLHWKQIKNAA